MDVPGVRGLRKELDTLAQIGQRFESRQIVLNFVDARGLLSVADVEATIGTGVDLLLPRSKAVLTSVNQGVPLLQSGGRDPMTKQLRRLVDRLTTGDPAVQPAQGKPAAQRARTTSRSRPTRAEPSPVATHPEGRWRHDPLRTPPGAGCIELCPATGTIHLRHTCHGDDGRRDRRSSDARRPTVGW